MHQNTAITPLFPSSLQHSTQTTPTYHLGSFSSSFPNTISTKRGRSAWFYAQTSTQHGQTHMRHVIGTKLVSFRRRHMLMPFHLLRGGGHTFWPCGELKTRGEAQPLSQESEIVSSALNLHFISCTDCHLPNACVWGCVHVHVCGCVCLCSLGQCEKEQRKKEAGGKSKEERKRNKNCLSPKLCVINVKLLSLSPPLLLAPDCFHT